MLDITILIGTNQTQKDKHHMASLICGSQRKKKLDFTVEHGSREARNWGRVEGG